MSTGKAASVLARLLSLAQASGNTHDYIITRYAQERFLYRLSTGKHKDSFVLKGGLLLTAMTSQFYRSTRDIDVRAFIENNPNAVVSAVIEGISHDVEEDGITFDLGSVRVEEIHTQGDESGLRVLLDGRLGNARVSVQFDMGFGDQILLPQASFEYPVLLKDNPVPVLRVYSVESMIAEKIEAIASLGDQNSRYKDFDDVLALAMTHTLDVAPLYHAIMLTFDYRGTSVSAIMPALLDERATPEREVKFTRYRTRLKVRAAPTTFAQQLGHLRSFVQPIVSYADDGISRKWESGEWKTE